MIRSIDVSNAGMRDDLLSLVEKNPDTEMAFVAWGKIIDDTTAKLSSIFEYTGTWVHKQEGQVSFDAHAEAVATQKIISLWQEVIGQGHQHMENKWHAHDFSNQDKETIEHQHAPLHLLAYRTEDGTARLKAVDTNMETVPFYVHGKRMEIVELFDNGMVEEYREAA